MVTRVTAKEPYARKDPEISDLGPNVAGGPRYGHRSKAAATVPSGAPAHSGTGFPPPPLGLPGSSASRNFTSGSARSFRSPWRRGALGSRRLWVPSTRPWDLAALFGSRRRAPATYVPETSWRRSARCRRASGTERWAWAGPGSAAMSSLERRGPLTRLSSCRCPSVCSMRWPACRAQAWPRFCAARGHPRAWSSSCSGPLSLSACSARWRTMPRPPRPPRRARASSCTAHRCAPLLPHSV